MFDAGGETAQRSSVRSAQRRDDRGRTALDPDPLDARFCAGRDCDVPNRDTGRTGDQPAKRGIGLAVGRRRAHPSLDDSLAVVPALNAFNCIAPAAWRQTHVDEDSVRRSPSMAARRRSKNVRQNIELDDVADKNDDQEQDDGRNVDAPKVR